jgi:hypothetical protein
MRTSTLLLSAVLALSSAGSSSADPSNLPPNIRARQPWIAAAVSAGLDRSATLLRLVRDLEASPVIIYLDEVSGAPAEWDGRIRFVSHAGSTLYVHIEIRRHAAALTAALVAHELQHAVEMVAADVRTAEDFAGLFRRIGVRGPGAVERYDTQPAIGAGVATLQELGRAGAEAARRAAQRARVEVGRPRGR